MAIALQSCAAIRQHGLDSTARAPGSVLNYGEDRDCPQEPADEERSADA